MEAMYVRSYMNESSSSDIYDEYYRDIDKRVYEEIVKSDPTSVSNRNGKYVKWMIDRYRELKREGHKFVIDRFVEDLYKVREALVLFDRYRNRLEKKQIQMYKSVYELINVMDEYEERGEEERESKDKVEDIKKNQTKRVYEDSEWIVVIPISKESSCFWGMGTKWCTAAREDRDNMFKNYNSQGILYIVISKKLKDDKGRQVKFQFHFETMQYMNVKDEVIDKEEYDLFSRGLKDFLISKIIEVYAAYLWAKKYERTERLKEIVLDSDLGNLIYKWAKNIGDREEMKEKIIKSGNIEYIYRWAINLGNEDEMKQVILNDTEEINLSYAIKWAKNIGDREEMKQLIIKSGNIETLYRDWETNKN